MQLDEVIVARMKGGTSVGRFLGEGANIAGRSRQVRISIGRNKEARLPAERIILTTGFIAEGEEQLEEFRRSVESLASKLDLTEVWEIVRDEDTALSLDDIAELHWGPTPSGAQMVAMLLHLDRSSLYFVDNHDGYLARSKQSVEEIQARRQRAIENAQASETLAESLSRGTLPAYMTPYQAALIEHLRGYAVHGENYTRSAAASGLLQRLETGARDLQRLSFETLVRIGVLSPDEPLELERAEIVEEFPEDALAEAGALDIYSILDEPRRRDLTALPTVTIDDAETQDKDDAVSLEIVRDQPSQVFRLSIHIADGAALIAHGGAIDQEADRRMSTLYLPERQITMLPPRVSHEIGSLLPDKRRAALSLLVSMTESGDVLDWEVTPSVIRSQAALAYEEVDGAIDDDGHSWNHMMNPLNRLALALRQKREHAGAVMMGRAEMRIEVRSSGEVDVRVLPSTTARQMVAELMILSNSLLAEFCRDASLPAAYRSQAAPDLEDIPKDTQDGPLRRYLMMRRLTPADLDTVPAPHAGLGVPAYIQATSPLRRYPDLVMQRQISHFLSYGGPLYSTEDITSVAQRAEVQLKEVGKLEEERKRYWFLKFLDQRLSDEGNPSEFYRAVVLENQPGRTAYLELEEYPYRVRAKLPETCAPGESVTLRLHGVDLWRRVGHFIHAPHAAQSEEPT